MGRISKKIRNSKLSNKDIEELRKDFIENRETSWVVNTLKINRHTVNRYYEIFRVEFIKAEKERLHRTFNWTRTKCKDFDYELSEIDNIKPPDNAQLNIYLVIAEGQIFATVRFNTQENLIKPILYRKYSRAKIPYKWISYPESFDKNIQISYIFLKVIGTDMRRRYNSLLRLFVKEFFKSRKSHHGISKNRLYYYIKEIEWRINSTVSSRRDAESMTGVFRDYLN
jgi:hypothetical protein